MTQEGRPLELHSLHFSGYQKVQNDFYTGIRGRHVDLGLYLLPKSSACSDGMEQRLQKIEMNKLPVVSYRR
jgi:hypothetical protein